MELGAEMLGSSMIIGESAYEVIAGFLGTPVADASDARAAGLPSDEELLARYLVQDQD
jgi:hypothetical protein